MACLAQASLREAGVGLFPPAGETVILILLEARHKVEILRSKRCDQRSPLMVMERPPEPCSLLTLPPPIGPSLDGK